MSDIRAFIICVAALAASPFILGAEAPSVANTQLAQLGTPTGVPQAAPAAVRAQPAATAELIEKVRQLDARRAALKDFRARFAVTLKKGKRDYALKGDYAGKADGDFRLSMNWGILSIIDVAFQGDQVDLWLPRKGKHCLGPRTLVREVPNDLRLLERIGSVSDLFFPDAWAQNAIARRLEGADGQYFLNVIERCDGELLPARRVQLGSYRDQCVVVKTILYEEGKAIGAVEYRDYYVIGGWLIPRTVEVWASAETRIVLTVEGIAINTGRPLDMAVRTPSGVKEADLAETLKAGKLLE